MKHSDLLKALTRELMLHGVSAHRLDRRGKHLKLRFVFRGRQVCFVFPRSPSDYRGADNALSTLRRVLGVKRTIHKSQRPAATHQAPRRNRDPALPRLFDPIVTNEFEKLSLLRDRLSAAANDNAPQPPHPATPPAPTADGVKLTTPWLGRRQR